MDDRPSLLKACGMASLVAGPLFVTLFALFSSQEQAAAVMQFKFGSLAAFLFLLPVSTAFGAIIAFPTCVLVGGALAALAARLPLLRATALWLLVAGGTGLALTIAMGFDFGGGSIAFSLTAIACAAIVRSRLHWD